MNKLSEDEGKYVVKIEVSSGDHINELHADTLNFLNFPFNIGVFQGKRSKDKEVVVIGKSLNSGQKVSVIPIAKLAYIKKDEGLKEMVIARPAKAELMTADIDNFFELISVHYGIQKVIETWILYSDGYGEVTDIKWSDENEAIEFLSI